jgi:hypothetical protein
MALGGAISVANLALQVWWTLISPQDWSKHRGHWIASAVLPIVAVLAIHIAWRLGSAPWRVHQDQEAAYALAVEKAANDAVLLRNEIAVLKDRLSPKLHISPLANIQPWPDARGNCVSYYIDVENRSEGTTINGVKVKLTGLSPDHLKWLPLPLHIKHDNDPPYKTEFDLNPLEKMQIDLVSSVQGSPVIDIVHIIGRGAQVNIPAGKYTLTVTANGHNVLPATANFDVWVDHTGYLRCQPLREMVEASVTPHSA